MIKKRDTVGLFIVAADGINNYSAGVGTSVIGMINTINSVYNKIKISSIDLKFYLITPYLKDGYNYKNQSILESNKNIVTRFNGEFIEIDNATNGESGFGNDSTLILNWETGSKNASKEILKRIPRHDKNIIICIDTPFLKAPKYLQEQNALDDNVFVVIAPQSTDIAHESNMIGRFQFELNSFSTANENKNVFVSYISKYFKKHLNIDYSIKKEKLIPFFSGPDYLGERLKIYSQKEIKQILENKYHIPTKRNIIFIVGRLAICKGIDEALKMAAMIDKKHKPFIVVLGFTYRDFEYVEYLKNLKKDLKLDGVFFDKLDTMLPILLWQWKNTNLSIHLSRNEPFGLAPCEARFLAKKYGPIAIVSDRGGLKEQITNYNDGIVCRYGSILSYKRAINYIYSLNSEELNKIKKTSYETVMRKYDPYKNFLQLLSKFTINLGETNGRNKNRV